MIKIDEINKRCAEINWTPETCGAARQGATLGDTLIELTDIYEGCEKDWNFIVNAPLDIKFLLNLCATQERKIILLRNRLDNWDETPFNIHN